MTQLLYLGDSYLKEIDTSVISVDATGMRIVLDKTIFYPEGGGQPSDHGTLMKGSEVYRVKMVKKSSEGVAHEVDKTGLKVGDNAHLILDWNRRYILMRYHTAAHLLSAVIYGKTRVETTGNQLDVDKSRMDFCLEDASKERIEKFIQQANELILNDAPVKTFVLSKEDAKKDPSLFKLAVKDYIERLKEVRVVDIEGIDKQADGGTHVHSLKEVGKISLLKIDNKGRNNRRIYFTLGER